MAFYNKDINQLFKDLNTSKNGLTNNQVEINKKKYGSNETEKQKHTNFLVKFLLQFKNIMIIILIISAIISLVTAITENDYENLFEGILIFIIVIINAIVGVIQEQKAENALVALTQKTEPFAKVTRNGLEEKIRVHELVVGDIVRLKAGDYVPADIRLFDSSNLTCDESSLTGESLGVMKNSNILLSQNAQLSSQSNMCFSGTNVKSGTGLGVVVGTGKNTELGKIAKVLSSAKKDKTPLEKNIDKIGKVITVGVLGIVVTVFLVQILFNKNIMIMQALLTSVALAVAAIPESLPAVITIIMALGVQKLAHQNAIIKRLSAVETLGCCNIICTDKTGTLTKNEMTASHIFTFPKTISAQDYNCNSSNMLTDICSVCNESTIGADGKPIGDATECAILNMLTLKKINHIEIKNSYQILQKNEFNSTRKMMSLVVQKNVKYLFVKGAIDYLLPKCTKYLSSNAEKDLTESVRQKIITENETICGKGERVIAFAYKQVSDNFEESELVFVGFIGIMDPPRKEVLEAIKTSKKAGLKTIMITGDHPATAFAIANKLGIAKTKKEVLTGSDIDKLGKKELKKIITDYSVFARVTPDHKLKIVESLKSNGNVVAMTGDGVNDAPSIKQASIGLSMGITGTDVTKEVSDVIISDDNFSTIVATIEEGRTIYQNITKTILFLLSTNVVEVLGIFVTSLVLRDAVFLLPAQILFINLVTDSLPAFALGIEPPDEDIMKTAPRDSSKSLLSGTIGTSILYQGFIQTLVVLVMFVIAKNKCGNEIASTMSFLTICLMQIIHAINCKTEKSIFRINIFNNKFFNFSFVALLLLILAVYFIPPIASIFSLVKLNTNEWIAVIATSLAIIPAVEIGKIFIKEKEIN